MPPTSGAPDTAIVGCDSNGEQGKLLDVSLTLNRTIPRTVAPVITELELNRPAVVTTRYLDQLVRQLGLPISGGQIAAKLRALGWLLPIRTKGAWEFAPADR